MFIKWIIKIITVINANTRPAHVAGGIACGLLLALVPTANLLWILLLALTFFFKINSTMEFVFLGLFKLCAPITTGVRHTIGWAVLTNPGLEPLFTKINNVPFLPFTKFNNTLVAGGLVLGLLLWIPVFLLTMLLLKLYRQYLREKIANTKFIKKLKQLPLLSQLLKLSQKAAGMDNGN